MANPTNSCVASEWGALILILFFALPLSLDAADSNESQSFGFLEPLVGCHKGEKVQGVHQLKGYLEKFGYLGYNHHAASANSDIFDDPLESAVKNYQLNYNLNPTGTLDPQTVNQMMQPRCGVADIINGTTRMPSGTLNNHHHNGSLLHVVSHYTFFSGAPRWPPSKTHLTYKFRSSAEVVKLAELRPAVSRAFGKWAAVTKFKFKEVSGGSDSDLEIGFHKSGHGDGVNFDGPGGVLAHAFRPTIGWFHYDADEKWSTNPSNSEFDLESLALHEMGHLLGLGHSNVGNAVMFPSISPGVKKRQLQEDDVKGIRDLYSS